jgi:hypothetical protein
MLMIAFLLMPMNMQDQSPSSRDGVSELRDGREGAMKLHLADSMSILTMHAHS